MRLYERSSCLSAPSSRPKRLAAAMRLMISCAVIDHTQMTSSCIALCRIQLDSAFTSLLSSSMALTMEMNLSKLLTGCCQQRVVAANAAPGLCLMPHLSPTGPVRGRSSDPPCPHHLERVPRLSVIITTSHQQAEQQRKSQPLCSFIASKTFTTDSPLGLSAACRSISIPGGMSISTVLHASKAFVNSFMPRE
jgi:hypothetical protein